MELPSKNIWWSGIYYKTKVEEHMLIATDKSTHEEHLSQLLYTNIKQFKVAVTFLTDYNDIFNVTNKNNKFSFTVSINDGDFSVFAIPAGA